MFRFIEWLFSRTGKNPFKRYNVKGNVICEKTVATEGTFRNFLSIPLFDNVVGRITRAECPSVCLDSNCGRVGGDIKKLRLKERFGSCMSVPIQLNRIGRIPHSPTVNRIGTTCNTAANIKTNSLTIFVPGAFYLVR
jgi:hypothetical protein